MSRTADSSMGSRRATRRGKASRQPAGVYDAPEPVLAAGGRLLVEFCGRDGRRKVFDFGELPIAGMRADLAGAFAMRIGHTGTLNTLASAATRGRR